MGPVEILCHLRDVDAEITIPRIHTIRTESNPVIEGINADKWADERNYHLADWDNTLAEFIDQRMVLLETLNSIEMDEWAEESRHTILGPTSLFEIIKIAARHDRLHIHQLHKSIERISA